MLLPAHAVPQPYRFDVAPDELHRLLHEPGLQHGAVDAHQRDDRPAQRAPFAGVVVLLRPEVRRRVDLRLRQEPARVTSEQHQPGERGRMWGVLVQELRVDQQRLPGRFLLRAPFPFAVLGEKAPPGFVLVLCPGLGFLSPCLGRGGGRGSCCRTRWK